MKEGPSMNFQEIKDKAEKTMSNGAPRSFFHNSYTKVNNSFIEQLKKHLDDSITSLGKEEKETLFFLIQTMISSKTRPLEGECRNLRIKMNAVLIVLGILVTLIGSFIVPLSISIMNGG